jgi:hypothetical protein
MEITVWGDQGEREAPEEHKEQSCPCLGLHLAIELVERHVLTITDMNSIFRWMLEMADVLNESWLELFIDHLANDLITEIDKQDKVII